MSDDLEKLTYEEAYAELEGTVERLEAGELDLQKAISVYERGMHLAQHCGGLLDAAELQVQELTLASGQQQMGMFLADIE